MNLLLGKGWNRKKNKCEISHTLYFFVFDPFPFSKNLFVKFCVFYVCILSFASYKVHWREVVVVSDLMKYWCRLSGCPDKCEFLQNGMNIIDVLAILPYYVELSMAIKDGSSNEIANNDIPIPLNSTSYERFVFY